MARAIGANCTGCGILLVKSDEPVHSPAISYRLQNRRWVQKAPMGIAICDVCKSNGFPTDWWSFPHQPGTNLAQSFNTFVTKLKEQFPNWDGVI